MKKSVKRTAAAAGLLAAASALVTGTAQADDGPVYFSAGNFQCAIATDGSMGCDIVSPTTLRYGTFPITLTVRDIVIDQSWLPARPSFTTIDHYTRPGGNPPLDQVRTGDGQWGPYVEFAGARCEYGFHGSFTCTAKGRSFSAYGGVITA
ncbi:hypothetical protein [Nocardia arizonensis]|uniref:hypothetical protein n=1 Tax=Nocardia arizonensis TaxID=1141647 RepID=UPI0006D2940D|nr:hypothetical protein [Nocardia arizonensis]